MGGEWGWGEWKARVSDLFLKVSKYKIKNSFFLGGGRGRGARVCKFFYKGSKSKKKKLFF